MKVLIIGSGIAGLSAAIALRRVGIEVKIHERAPELHEVGAGISLWYNALRALEYIGAVEAVRQRAIPMTHSELRTHNGNVIVTRLDARRMAESLGVPEFVSMIHRADLVAALASLLPAGVAHYGCRCVEVSQTDRQAVAKFADGTHVTADVILGADGISSVVRNSILGKQMPRYAGYTCWRGICPCPSSLQPGYIGEWWGAGCRIGITTLPQNRVYWWAVKNEPAERHEPDEKAYLLRSFGNWADPVPSLLELTPNQLIFRNDILDRPPSPGWSRGRIGLIGDAAHPTTPNLGQGGCMAIEDAVVIARHLSREESVAQALQGFEAERYGRTKSIVVDSYRFGVLAQRQSWIGVLLRNCTLRLLLATMGDRSILKHTNHDVGPLPTKNQL